MIKSKQEVENLLNDLDKKPNAIDHILNFFKNFIKYIVIHAGAGTALAGVGAAAGAISGIGAIPGMILANPAATPLGIILLVTVSCCTHIYRVKGSIADKRKATEKMITIINQSIPKAKDEETKEALEKAKEKCEAKLEKIEKSAAGRSKFYQNTHSESTLY